MILWVDDVREPPNDKEYSWVFSVNQAKNRIQMYENRLITLQRIDEVFEEVCGEHSSLRKLIPNYTIDYIDIDHDAGDYVSNGGDYIKILDWLEETGRNYPIRIHSANPVGIANMRRIIQRNGWKEVM